MNFKKLSLILTFFFWNQKVLSKSVSEESTIDLFESDSEDILDSLVEDVEMNVEDITILVEPSDNESVITEIVESNIEECLTDNCFETSNFILSNMDTSVNPCDDFYQYTCGGWISKQQGPGEISYEQEKMINEEIVELLSSDYKVNKKLSKEDQEYDEKTFNMLKNIYNMCIISDIEDVNVENDYLAEFFRNLNIYEIEGESKAEIFTNLLVKLQNSGLRKLFYFNHYDLLNLEKKVFSFIPDLEAMSDLHYLNGTEEMNLHFKEYIKKVLSVIYQKEKDIEEKVEIIYEIEQKFSDIQEKLINIIENNFRLFDTMNVDQNEEYELIDLDTLNKRYPFIDWKLFLKKKIDFYGVENVDFNLIMVYDVFAVINEVIIDIFNEMDVKSFSTYLEWYSLLSLRDLSNDIRNAIYEIKDYYNNSNNDNVERYSDYIYGEFNEYPSSTPYNEDYTTDFSNYNNEDNEEYPTDFYNNNDNEYDNDYDNEYNNEYNSQNECIILISRIMPMALTKYYFDRKLSDDAKYEIKQMIENIRESMFDRIQNAEWLDKETKQGGIEKLLKMKDNIGYPEEYNDPKIIYEKYKYLDIKDYFNYSLLKNRDAHELEMLSKSEYSNPMDVNAFYLPFTNTMVINAGTLHSPNYNITSPDYINYGVTGTTIGHEFTHGFDNIEKKYDSNGEKNNWWTKNDEKDFNKLSQCLIDQYDNYTVLINHKQFYIDGKNTLAENIADNSGLNRGYEAWKKSMLENPEKAVQRNQKLPGFSGYTLDQLFFIAYGQSNCEVLSEFQLDNHSPGKARTNVVLSNSKEFAKAFNCPTGSPMNPEKKCLVW